MNYYPFHIGDFRSGSVNMTRHARWIYRDMMDVYYDAEKPLSIDLDVLCDQLGVMENGERAIVERLLRFKFIKSEDGYRHEICDQVIAEYHAKAEIAKANGKLGGRPPKAKAKQKEPSGFPSGYDPVASGVADLTGSEANQEPITKNHRKPKPSSSSGDAGPGEKPFDQFWKAYPRKVGKVDAQRAWTKLKPDAELVAAILAAIAAQLEGHDWKREAGEFIPHPATWINGGRWLDEVRPYVERAPRQAFDAWWETKESMEAKGKSLTPPVLALAGDTVGSFKRRINEALERAGQPEQKREPTPYTPPAPAGGESVLSDEQKRARRQELLAVVGSRKNIEAEEPEIETAEQ